MFAALKWERGRRAEKGRKRQTWSWKKLSSRFELLVGLALNRLLTVKSTAMKVRFVNGAKNKFAAFPQTRRNQIRISFVISWEKFLGWNFLPFNRSSRALRLTLSFFWRSFMHSLCRLGHFYQLKWVLAAFRTYVCTKTSVAIARLDAHVS